MAVWTRKGSNIGGKTRHPSESEIAVVVLAMKHFTEDMLLYPGVLRGSLLRGSVVADFEHALAEHCGYDYCLATCNATVEFNLVNKSQMGQIGIVVF